MKYILTALVCCLLLAGCTSTTVVTYDTVAITENPVGTKIGQVDRNQGGILEAARNGSITRISTVSIQNTDKYTRYFINELIYAFAGMGSAPPVHTVVAREIIVTGE